MEISNINNILNENRKLLSVFFVVIALFNIFMINNAFAGDQGVDQTEVSDLRQRIIDATKDISLPLGGALIFVSVVLIAIRIIVAHYNPKARSEAMEGLKWVAIGSVLLGMAVLIANIIITMGGAGTKI